MSIESVGADFLVMSADESGTGWTMTLPSADEGGKFTLCR